MMIPVPLISALLLFLQHPACLGTAFVVPLSIQRLTGSVHLLYQHHTFRSTGCTGTTWTQHQPTFHPTCIVPSTSSSSSSSTTIYATSSPPGSDEEREEMEQARLRILQARRQQIRQTIQAANSVRQFRIQNNLVPATATSRIDPTTGDVVVPIHPDRTNTKLAVTLTAVGLAVGAVVLRLGGRAALASVAGLDFLVESPQIQHNVAWILQYADTIDPTLKIITFVLAWTMVKGFLLDAGGVVLALASGLLFGGVWWGALYSAAAATVGSCCAYQLAQLNTPVRTKAIQFVNEYPALRGIERAIQQDGLKTVLTLRLSPILPIPIGMYNYLYSVIGVPMPQVAGGIFLGSLKPYLLDSYLGCFLSKELIAHEATSTPEIPIVGTDWQDYLLLVALGISVLVGVFASQLASETWDSVIQEVEEEKKAKKNENDDTDERIIRTFLDFEFPQWVIGFQLSLREAEKRMRHFIQVECESQAWKQNERDNIPFHRDPARRLDSPEIAGAYQGIDVAASICDGLVLSPLLMGVFLEYADPMYDESRNDSDSTDDIARLKLLDSLISVKNETQQQIEMLDQQIRLHQ